MSTSLAQGFTFVNMWGSFGRQWKFDGQNNVDALNGRVYVADTLTIGFKFVIQRQLPTKWGTYGEENGQIHKASALSIVRPEKIT